MPPRPNGRSHRHDQPHSRTTRTTFQSLSPEILSRVASLLPRRSLPRVALTSKRLRKAVEPVMYEYINLDALSMDHIMTSFESVETDGWRAEGHLLGVDRRFRERAIRRIVHALRADPWRCSLVRRLKVGVVNGLVPTCLELLDLVAPTLEGLSIIPIIYVDRPSNQRGAGLIDEFYEQWTQGVSWPSLRTLEVRLRGTSNARLNKIFHKTPKLTALSLFDISYSSVEHIVVDDEPIAPPPRLRQLVVPGLTNGNVQLVSQLVNLSQNLKYISLNSRFRNDDQIPLDLVKALQGLPNLRELQWASNQDMFPLIEGGGHLLEKGFERLEVLICPAKATYTSGVYNLDMETLVCLPVQHRSLADVFKLSSLRPLPMVQHICFTTLDEIVQSDLAFEDLSTTPLRPIEYEALRLVRQFPKLLTIRHIALEREPRTLKGEPLWLPGDIGHIIQRFPDPVTDSEVVCFRRIICKGNAEVHSALEDDPDSALMDDEEDEDDSEHTLALRGQLVSRLEKVFWRNKHIPQRVWPDLYPCIGGLTDVVEPMIDGELWEECFAAMENDVPPRRESRSSFTGWAA